MAQQLPLHAGDLVNPIDMRCDDLLTGFLARVKLKVLSSTCVRVLYFPRQVNGIGHAHSCADSMVVLAFELHISRLVLHLTFDGYAFSAVLLR